MSDVDFDFLTSTIYNDDTGREKQNRNMNYFGTAQTNLLIKRHIHINYTKSLVSAIEKYPCSKDYSVGR